MFGIAALVLVGVAVWLGYSGGIWAWCLGLAAVGVPVYYGTKGTSSQAVADIQHGAVRWFVWIYGSQVATMSFFYGFGYLLSTVF